MHHSYRHLHKLTVSKKKNIWHNIVVISSIIYPLTTIGQVIEIFSNQSAENISLFTYLFYLFFTLIFLGYGISDKLKPIIILQSLWLVMYSAVVVGILVYG